ncbi:hypothetical protein PMIN02_009662 [Paraphaeosphaeria minitans]|uniref:Uncharacterized protein n=1 Tax=Paraphaeosphaeria minitans TaxID=565426 RepID=A0A9P6KN66_9PLEO|nr:hypothetical protein PMIN01_09289 [Paraphaeosphaeria minitans]
MDGGILLEPIKGEASEENGQKRTRSTEREAGNGPRTNIKQGRSWNRTRRRHQQERSTGETGESFVTQDGLILAEPSNPNQPAEEQDEELVLDDDEDDEVGGEEGRDDNADYDDDKPKVITAKMKKRMDIMAKMVQKEAGHVILTLEQHDLTPTPTNVVWEQDKIKLLCSYNWQGANDGTNTIFVPGGPAKFVPKTTFPYVIEQDSGFQAADYNYVRKPRDPFAPLFTALGVMNPGFQFSDIDVLADRNNLRILLEFCQGKSNGPLRLDVHMISNTLVFVRKGEKFWRRQTNGIGNNFEKNFTQPGDDMEDATSHYRAIQYPVGPLNIVVRFEADAYFEDCAPGDLDPTGTAAVTGALLAERPHYDFRPPVRFLQKGHIVPTAQMAELKTVTHKEEGTSSVACQDQLWFGRTTHLLTGVYKIEDNKGKILRLKYENAKARVDKWEEKNQEALRKLVDLLLRIRAALKQQEGPVRAGLLVRESRDGPLVLRNMLRKSHIIGREFFSTHWQRNPAGALRGHNMRGRGSADRSYQERPQHGLRGYHPQSGTLRGNVHQSQPGGSGATDHPYRQGLGEQYTWQQQQIYGANEYRHHHRYSGQNPQQPSGGYGGNNFPPQNGYGGRYDQLQPQGGRGGRNGNRGAGPPRGYPGGRGRDRGRGGSNHNDPNYGRLPEHV